MFCYAAAEMYLDLVYNSGESKREAARQVFEIYGMHSKEYAAEVKEMEGNYK